MRLFDEATLVGVQASTEHRGLHSVDYSVAMWPQRLQQTHYRARLMQLVPRPRATAPCTAHGSAARVRVAEPPSAGTGPVSALLFYTLLAVHCTRAS